MSDDSLAALFLKLTVKEKEVLPSLRLTEQQKAADLDLYRRLKKLDKQKQEE